MLGGMLAVLYFIMIRPEAKSKKKHQTMISALKRGDEVILTTFGKVVSVDQQILTIEIADKTKIKVLKNAVTALSKSLPKRNKIPTNLLRRRKPVNLFQPISSLWREDSCKRLGKSGLLVALVVAFFGGYLVWPTVTYFSLSEAQLAEVKKSKDAFRQFIPEWPASLTLYPVWICKAVSTWYSVSTWTKPSQTRRVVSLTDFLVNLKKRRLLQKKYFIWPMRIRETEFEVIFKDPSGVDKYNSEVDLFTDLAVLIVIHACFRLHPNLLLPSAETLWTRPSTSVLEIVDSMVSMSQALPKTWG